MTTERTLPTYTDAKGKVWTLEPWNSRSDIRTWRTPKGIGTPGGIIVKTTEGFEWEARLPDETGSSWTKAPTLQAAQAACDAEIVAKLSNLR